MKKNLFKIGIKIGAVVSGFIPYLVLAQNYVGSQTTGTASGFGSIKQIIDGIGKFISTKIMPLLVVLALGYFFWNLIQYIRSFDNEKEREGFRRYTVNSLLGLFIMFSLWGIIGIATQTFFNAQPIIPQFKTNPNGGTTPV